jgi:mercuric reductase
MSHPIEWELVVRGMTCPSCAEHVDRVLRAVPGVHEAAATWDQARVRVVAEPSVDATAFESALSGTRYRVERAERHAPAPGSSQGAADLVIVGGGSAAFAAAIRAADLGARVVIVESGTTGGTCVNVGCVPSKTLIRAALAHHLASHPRFAGLRAQSTAPDLAALVRQKDELVTELRTAKYEDVLAAYPSASLRRGTARFGPDGTLRVDGEAVAASKVVIATGAAPTAPPIPGLEAGGWLTSTEALTLTELPSTLAVLGGGAVGLELAQLFARLGTRVTVLEALPRLLPGEEPEISDALAGYLREEEIDVRTGAAIERVSGGRGAWRIAGRSAGEAFTVEASELLVATGRRAHTEGLGLEEAGIRTGRRGEIVVDEHLETTRPGVYAAGDVIGDPMFVYVAAQAGQIAAENALRGNDRSRDLRVVPRVTFTDPAVASVGLGEAEARQRGHDVRVAHLPLAHVPAAIVARDTRGLLKLVVDRASGRLLGAHVLGHEAPEMIAAPAMAIRFGLPVGEIAGMLHAYLTHGEAFKLAILSLDRDVARLSCCAA